VKARRVNHTQNFSLLTALFSALQNAEKDRNSERAKSEGLSAQIQESEVKLADIPRLQEQLTQAERGAFSVQIGVHSLIGWASDAGDAKAQLDAERAKAAALHERLANSDSTAADVGRLEAELAGLSSGTSQSPPSSWIQGLTGSTEAKARSTELDAEREKASSLTNELQQAKAELEELPKLRASLASMETGMCGPDCSPYVL
jgi:Tfp pilus assembly protein PilO